jgi:hypothetical protein
MILATSVGLLNTHPKETFPVALQLKTDIESSSECRKYFSGFVKKVFESSLLIIAVQP